ncbi:MAG TPA: ABC transporter ATP-binding protein, partial [Burkholderiales bacterium]|nr:ABC transporter ATP-binding protein [Burkholderiales bacterium]
AVILIKGGLNYTYYRLSIAFKNKMNAQVLQALHAQLVEMPYLSLRRRSQATWLHTTSSEAWQVANAAYLLTRIAISAMMAFAIVALAFLLSWPVAMLGLAGAAAIAFAGQSFSRRARAAALHVRSHIEAMHAVILTALQDGRLIRAYGYEEAQKQRFAHLVEQMRSHLEKSEAAQSVVAPFNEAAQVMLLLGLVSAAYAMHVPQASTVAIIALLYRAGPFIREMEGSRVSFAALAPGLKAVAVMLTQPTYRQTGRAQLSSIGTLQFENVSVTLQSGPASILHDACFTIAEGRINALVGPSGAGKTTIVNLLLRLFPPSSGVIRAHGQDIWSFDRLAWLERIAVAGQDVELCEGTIADNLRIGRANASLDDMREAAADALILPFIEALPRRFDTRVGARGFNISGGQRQRIALARALLRKPELLILDEATNAVEGGLEAELMSNVRRRLPEATILVVAHKPSRDLQIDHAIDVERLGDRTDPQPLLDSA